LVDIVSFIVLLHVNALFSKHITKLILKGLKLWHWYYLYIFKKWNLCQVCKCEEKYVYEFDVYINFY